MIFLLLLLIPAIVTAQVQYPPDNRTQGEIEQYSAAGGLNTKPSHTIPITDFKDMLDCYTDDGYPVARDGLKTIWNSTGPIQSGIEVIFLDGSRYCVIKSSKYLGYIDANSTYQQLLTTMPVNANLWKMQLKDECFLGTDAKTDRWKFTPSETQVLAISTFIPVCKYPIVAGDKVFALNISTPRANLAGNSEGAITTSGDESIMRYCKIGNIRDWPGDFWLGVTRGDGEVITGGFVYKGNLHITKDRSTAIATDIWNNTNEDYEKIIPINPNIGCISHNSIREIGGVMRWLSADGVVEYNGSGYSIISQDIEDKIAEIADSAAVGVETITETTALDFGAGSVTGLVDTTTISGSFMIKATKNQINQRNDFYGAYNDVYVRWFLDGKSVDNTHEQWQEIKSSYTLHLSSIAVLVSEDYNAATNGDLTISIKNASLVLLASSTINKSLTSGTAAWVYIDFSNWGVYVTSGVSHYIYLNSTATSYGYMWWGGYSADPYPRGTSSGSGQEGGGDFAFRLSQYHYNVGDYGLYASQLYNLVNPDWEQWGAFNASYESLTAGDTGDGVQWFISAASVTALVGTGYLTAITTGFTVPATEGAYCKFYASMTTTSEGTSPRINSISADYIVSSGNSEDVITSYSDEENNRYYLAGVIDNGQYNNVIYCYQGDSGKWVPLGINARSMFRFKNKLYIGESTLGDKSASIWEYSSDYTDDDGVAFSPYVQTPDIAVSRYRDQGFNTLWAYAEPSTVYSNMTVGWYLNKSGTAYDTETVSLAADTTYGSMFIKKRLLSDLSQGRYRTISFKFTDFGKLYGWYYRYFIYNEGTE